MAIEILLAYTTSSPTTLAGAAFILVFCFLLWMISKNHRTINKILPPEAGGARPIIGHFSLIAGSQLAHVNLGALADKYGPCFTIRLGLRRALVVSSYEFARQLFTAHDMIVLSRPEMLSAKYLSYDYAMISFSDYGPYWREIRRLIALELLSARRLELLKHIRVSEIEISLKELYKFWDEKKDVSGGRVLVEMKQWFGDLTLNVILRMVAGKRYSGAIDAADEKDKEEARRCQEVLRKFFDLAGVFLVGDCIPYLRWFDIGGYEKKMKVAGREMDLIMEGWLQEHRKKKGINSSGVSGEANNNGDRHQDFMDVVHSVTEASGGIAGYNADIIAKAVCLNVIVGAFDTTLVMLTWALSLLMNNPKALKKAQEEIDHQVGKERRITESDVTNLVYLQAIVKETLRLYPSAPLGGFRIFAEDCNLGGYHIPKGTILLLNLWKLHRDSTVWQDPSEFRPERFLSTHKNFNMVGNQFEFIPFGAGRRMCPGMNFGLQMLHLVLANLIQAFDLSTPSDELVDMTESPGLTNIKATPLQVLIAPRLSPTLY